jgi:hypothetical protein
MHYLGNRTPWTCDRVDEPGKAPAPTHAAPRGHLSREAVRLVISLQMTEQVRYLAIEFPHVLNRVAELWGQPQAAEDYFSALLLPDRSGRKGFNLQAMQEVVALRDRHRRRLAPAMPGAGRMDTDWRG